MKSNLKFYFIRHSKIDLPYKDHLEMPYDALDDLATSRLDPSISPNSEQLFLEAAKKLPLDIFDVIYYNNSGFQSKRSEESALLINKIIKDKYQKSPPILGNPDLKEIKFSLKEILPKSEFAKRRMSAVRTALYNAEINNGPVEQIKNIFTRIDRIFASLEKQKSKNGNILLVSHDFFMRVIEAYIRVSKDFKKITVDDLEKTTLNAYFKGFGVSYDLRLFERF